VWKPVNRKTQGERKMDPREIGNLFMIGFYGTRFDGEVRDLIEELNPCGVILFSRNIEDPIQTAELNRDVQSHALTQRGPGLFIGVDQEGGRVRRLQEPFEIFPPALQLASSDAPEDAVREFARVTAHEIRLSGFNVDFTPVLDVLDRAEDLSSSVIGDRSYGSDPVTVSRLGRIVIETMRSGGIIPCGKHYPGHGGTLRDSHVELPVDERSGDEIRRRDLVPFRDAVNMSVEMIMTAHILYPALDPLLPATLSPSIIGGMLRETLQYRGVVVTDDLDMAAVAAHFPIEDCARKALNAGVDILLVCNSPEKAFSARSNLVQAVKDSAISRNRIEESLLRIRHLKSGYAASLKPCDPAETRQYFAQA
jgi:beta-N-acetylhexosaminidase